MSSKTILTCALTGAAAWPKHHPNFPITPAQVAQSGLEAAEAGAAILHIHARDPQSGVFVLDTEVYREIVDRIRQKNSEVILNLTTGYGGTFTPTLADLTKTGPGTAMLPAEARVEHILELRPEICTLDLNTMQMGNVVGGNKADPMIVMNLEPVIVRMAELIRDAGVVPEIEIFEAGDLVLAEHLISTGALDGPGLYTLVLGLRYGLPSTPAAMTYAVGALPRGALWTGMGISRECYKMAAQSYLLGGHVRTGFEDNIYLGKGVLAPSNAAMVKHVRQMLEPMGAEFATPAEARSLLGLKP